MIAKIAYAIPSPPVTICQANKQKYPPDFVTAAICSRYCVNSLCSCDMEFDPANMCYIARCSAAVNAGVSCAGGRPIRDVHHDMHSGE